MSVLSVRSFGCLTVRNFRIFLRDRAGVFFSLLAPLIILLLYFLFLGDVQADSAAAALGDVPYDEKVLEAFVNGWMISGVVSVSCITVSFSAQSVMIADRERGMRDDVLVSPVTKPVLTAVYFASNCLITMAIVGVVLAVCLVFLAITGWYLSAADVFAAIGMTVMSALSAAMLSTLVCLPLRTSSVHSAVVGIMSAAIGFLMGAYMPVFVFPTSVRYIVLIVPGTYSAGVFRNIFCNGALAELTDGFPASAEQALRDGFTLDMDFFGAKIGTAWMTGIFAITIAVVALIAALVILISRLRRLSRA